MARVVKRGNAKFRQRQILAGTRFWDYHIFMNQNEIEAIVAKQRVFFLTGTTLDVDFRLKALKRLRERILAREDEVNAALKSDLGKSATESYMCEIGMALSELSYMIKHAKMFSRERRVETSLVNFPARSYQKPSPYGVVLVMSPWNYPFLLTIDPLIDALAAGNTVVLKPSDYSSATSEIIAKIIAEAFPPEYVAVIRGGRQENAALLESHFDYIFFTGGKTVGKLVMEKAAQFLTPVTLELGGKSPCIVDETADLALAAKRIVFGKFLNCGQTCVAPDYIFCDRKIKNALVAELKKQIVAQYGNAPLGNANYGKIINQKHFERICALIDKSKLAHGGNANAGMLQIEPTLLDNVDWNDVVMGEEIFGPVLPVLTYENLNDAIVKINAMEHPLALYIYTSSRRNADRVIERCGFGGACVNDCIMHLASTEMGFGGFGESGMGAYHGKIGFDTFTHYKSVLDKKTWLDLPMRYQPYKNIYAKLVRLFLR